MRQDRTMSLPVPDRSETLDSLQRATSAFCALVRSTRDGSPPAIGTWSVRDTAVHASHIFGVLDGLLTGGTSPVKDHRQMSQTWDGLVADDDETNLAKIADRIQASADSFARNATADLWESWVPWHGGLKIPTYGLASILLTEASIHGLDIARATGRPWGVPRSVALISIAGLLPVLPHFLDEEAARGLEANYRLKLRGGPTLFMRVADNDLVIDEAPLGRLDCTISADPLAYLLVGYGRLGRWGPIFKGQITAWGRRPQLSLRFAQLFVTP